MQKDKQERYLELLAGLRLMDDDFFSEALDEKIAPVEYILNTVLERDDIRVLRTEAQVEYKSAANRSIKLDIRAVDAEGRVMDIEVQRADRGAGVRRARFHSSMLDRTLLDKGKDFEDLVDTYVIHHRTRQIWCRTAALPCGKADYGAGRCIVWRWSTYRVCQWTVPRFESPCRTVDA